MTELKVVVSEQAESVVGILTKRDVIRRIKPILPMWAQLLFVTAR